MKWSQSIVLIDINVVLLIFNLLSVNSVPIEVHTHQVHEKRSQVPTGWIQGDRLEPNVILPVRIALAQSNMDKLHEYVMQVSDPDSPQYGQHWNPEDVRATFAPSAETRETVSHWLIASGISPNRIQVHRGSGGWIGFDATVQEAEKLFQTEYYSYSHDGALSSKPIAAVAESYSLPAHVRLHVDFVTPTLHFDARLGPQKKEMALTKSSFDDDFMGKRGNDESIILNQCDHLITPACIRALYKLPTLPASTMTNPNNSVGIVAYTSDSYLASDLEIFFKNYSTQQKQKTPTLISIDGGAIVESGQDSDNYIDPNLSLEYSMTLLNPIPVSIYQVGDGIGEAASNNDFLDALDSTYCEGDDSSQDKEFPDPKTGGYKGQKDCGNKPMTKVISTSYSYDEHTLTPAYEKRQCNEYAKLGLMGTTFVFGSGDFGVGGNYGHCLDPITKKRNNGSYGEFMPSFPSTCPYVLSVGATKIVDGKTVNDPESVWSDIYHQDNRTRIESSGGGFSNVFPLPDYQRSAVKQYFQRYKPPYTSSQYNDSQNTRGYPDVSINGGVELTIVSGKVRIHNGGVSAAVPLFASILTLINEERLNKGLSTLGFVNPRFYENPWMFNEIINGSNPNCGTNGFSAGYGWNPVAGLGTPNYPKMLDYFLKI